MRGCTKMLNKKKRERANHLSAPVPADVAKHKPVPRQSCNQVPGSRDTSPPPPGSTNRVTSADKNCISRNFALPRATYKFWKMKGNIEAAFLVKQFSQSGRSHAIVVNALKNCHEKATFVFREQCPTQVQGRVRSRSYHCSKHFSRHRLTLKNQRVI